MFILLNIQLVGIYIYYVDVIYIYIYIYIYISLFIWWQYLFFFWNRYLHLFKDYTGKSTTCYQVLLITNNNISV